MSNIKKLMMTAAGGGGLNVEEVFSTYLYTGNATDRTITNGIDLSTEGGLVWIKRRDTTGNHFWFDTERTLEYSIQSNETDGQSFRNETVEAYNTDGFDLGFGSNCNASSGEFASWTFRKAPKFFDVVTYTGNGTSNRAISHNLGTTVGTIFVKKTSGTENWIVYHVSQGNGKYANLNSTSAFGTYSGYWTSSPDDNNFYIGSDGEINGSGQTYVAYLFAHNDGDGDFGPTGDQDIIKCGSYTGAGSTDVDVNLGFEPQWLMIKKSSSSGDNWIMFDNMRGVVTGAEDNRLFANLTNTDYGGSDYLEFTSTGFRITGTIGDVASSGATYIYIAIRRGPMAVPESATDVFAIDTRGGTSPTPPAFYLGAPVDLQVWRSDITSSNNWEARDRLRGLYGRLKLNLRDAEDSNGGNEFSFDQMLGQGSATGTNTNRYSWMWKRAPSFFDVVAYTGNGVQGRNISHNLGVAPDMMWIKNRDDQYNDWEVYVSGITHLSTYGSDPSSYGDNPATLRLNKTNAANFSMSGTWDHTHPTSSVFRVGDTSSTNGNGENLIAYLFASLDGVSKVGSYTGNGSSNGDSQNIDCGFSSGARFVLIKRTDSTGNWLLFDTSRGIVSSGNDPALLVNSTGSNFTGFDFLEPNSNGFNVLYQGVSSSYNPNISGASYIFYAIA